MSVPDQLWYPMGCDVRWLLLLGRASRPIGSNVLVDGTESMSVGSEPGLVHWK